MEADVIDRDRRIAGGLRLADGTAEPADANDAGGRGFLYFGLRFGNAEDGEDALPKGVLVGLAKSRVRLMSDAS